MLLKCQQQGAFYSKFCLLFFTNCQYLHYLYSSTHALDTHILIICSKVKADAKNHNNCIKYSWNVYHALYSKFLR